MEHRESLNVLVFLNELGQVVLEVLVLFDDDVELVVLHEVSRQVIKVGNEVLKVFERHHVCHLFAQLLNLVNLNHIFYLRFDGLDVKVHHFELLDFLFDLLEAVRGEHFLHEFDVGDGSIDQEFDALEIRTALFIIIGILQSVHSLRQQFNLLLHSLDLADLQRNRRQHECRLGVYFLAYGVGKEV